MKYYKIKFKRLIQVVYIALIFCVSSLNSYSNDLVSSELYVNQSSPDPQITFDFDQSQWYHIAYTKPASGPGNIYVNGVNTGTIDWINQTYNHFILNIGASFYTSYFDFFEGTIDEIRVSSIVRSASDIQTYVASDLPFQNDSHTLQLWKFDEGAGEEFYNADNDLTGDMYGEPTWVDGKFGKAISFDGINDRLRVNYDLPEFGVTYEFWVKFDGQTKDTKQTIIQPYGTNSIEFTIQQDPDVPVIDPVEVQFSLPDRSVSQNAEVNLPVSVIDFENVLTAQFTISWDPAILEYKSIQDFNLGDLDAGSFHLAEDGKMTFSWSPADLQAVTVADGSEIFSITFTAIGNADQVVAIAFSDDPTPKEIADDNGNVMQATYTDGQISIYGMVDCGGFITTQTGNPLSNVEVLLTGADNATTITDETGWYNFTVSPNLEYQIVPNLEILADANVTTLDIVIMHWHILGIKLMPSNYDIISCDVNLSKSLTTLDLAETRGVILHRSESFGNRKGIDFINHEYTGTPDLFDYKNYLDITPNKSYTDLNFTAVKLGDASRNWKFNSGNNGREQFIEEIQIRLDPEEVIADRINVQIKSMDFEHIVGLQFTLEWDPEVYQFNKITEKHLNFISNQKLTSQGKMTFIWNSVDINGLTLDKASILSNLDFTVLDISSDPDIKITSGITPALAFNSNLEMLSIKHSSISNKLKIEELTLFPNPASNYINIDVTQKRDRIDFMIINSLGEMIREGHLDQERSISISKLMPGMYILQISDENNQVINKKFMKE